MHHVHFARLYPLLCLTLTGSSVCQASPITVKKRLAVDLPPNSQVAKGTQWRFSDAISYAKEHAVKDTVELELQPILEFLSTCVCMDAVNLDQALNVLFAHLTGNDH